MGRLHSKGKGISSSAIPYSRNPPSWLKTTPEQVVDQICKLAKKGATPSQIGVILRDSHGVAQVRVVTGMFLVRFEQIWGKTLLTLKSQVTAFCVSSSPTVRPHTSEQPKAAMRKCFPKNTHDINSSASETWNGAHTPMKSRLRLFYRIIMRLCMV